VSRVAILTEGALAAIAYGHLMNRDVDESKKRTMRQDLMNRDVDKLKKRKMR
jgi:hypothetical protein